MTETNKNIGESEIQNPEGAESTESKESKEPENAGVTARIKAVITNVHDLATGVEVQKNVAGAFETIAKSSVWNSTVVDFWTKLSPEDQKTLYERGEPTFINKYLSGGTFANLFRYDDNTLRLFAQDLAPICRWLVQLGMLPPPKGMPSGSVAKDVISDKATMDKTLKQLRVLLTLVAPALLVEFEAARRALSKTYGYGKGVAVQAQKKQKAA